MQENVFYLVPGKAGFQLWNGYVESESNLHYSRFYGFQEDGSECWVLERSEKQDVFVSITITQAYNLIHSYEKATE